jgi:hypothetical protein
MIDTDAEIREYLVGQASLTVLAGQRIYASLYLPKGYTPDDGPALLFSPRGGAIDYSSLVLNPSYQFRSYGKTLEKARELDRALFDALNDISYCDIKSARMEAIGQPLQEQGTGWPFVLSFYRIFLGNN